MFKAVSELRLRVLDSSEPWRKPQDWESWAGLALKVEVQADLDCCRVPSDLILMRVPLLSPLSYSIRFFPT